MDNDLTIRDLQKQFRRSLFRSPLFVVPYAGAIIAIIAALSHFVHRIILEIHDPRMAPASSIIDSPVKLELITAYCALILSIPGWLQISRRIPDHARVMKAVCSTIWNAKYVRPGQKIAFVGLIVSVASVAYIFHMHSDAGVITGIPFIFAGVAVLEIGLIISSIGMLKVVALTKKLNNLTPDAYIAALNQPAQPTVPHTA
jgi:hypothetical protein